MNQVTRCPVCGGTKNVPLGYYIEEDYLELDGAVEPCRNCNGIGWVRKMIHMCYICEEIIKDPKKIHVCKDKNLR